MVTRRAAIAGLGALPLAAHGATPLPFAAGDIVVGCTLLDDPQDDHRGRGRILHYDAALRLRQTLRLADTTHIVQGLRFAPDGALWAFDTFARIVARFGRDARRMADFRAPPRSFGHITFHRDGRFFLGDNFVGGSSRVPLRTTLPFMPGTQRYGDGHLFEFSRAGELLREHATPVHGGMGGFQGLCSSAIAPDGRTLVYTSESGPRIMRWDLERRAPLPDFVVAPETGGRFFFDVGFDDDGRLLIVTGSGVDAYDWPGEGESAATRPVARSYPLGSFGWASMGPPVGGRIALANFFSGEMAVLELAGGAVTARAQTGMRKSASGVGQRAA
jgi:hypothetical protein